MNIVRGIIGMLVIIGIAFIFSNNKKKIDWKVVAKGLLIQFVLALFIIKGQFLESIWSPLGWPKLAFKFISGFFVQVLNFTTEGAVFIFGNLARSPGTEGSMGMFFAFQVLPTIIFFASLTSVLYYLGVLQKVVKVMASGMQKLLGTSGAESLSVVSNIFVGQTEAPLVVKPYIEKFTPSELMAVMTGGMATIAGGVMAAYVQMLGNSYAQSHGIPLAEAQLLFAEQLLGASLMAAPAALVIAKMLVPETEEPVTKGDVKMVVEQNDANLVDAAASGAGEGLKLAANVGGMLLAFIALLAMFNAILVWIGDITTINDMLGQDLQFQTVLGWLFSPIAFAVGIPWAEAVDMGSLLGTKIVLNEFVAYLNLSQLVADGALSAKTVMMATFALCGFANFSSIAIQIGGIGGLAPSKKSDIARFGMRAILAGTLANLMTATIAGILF